MMMDDVIHIIIGDVVVERHVWLFLRLVYSMCVYGILLLLPTLEDGTRAHHHYLMVAFSFPHTHL